MKIANRFTRNLAMTCGMLVLAGAGQLSAQVQTAVTANILSFSHQQNSLTSPPAQSVRVLSNPSAQSFSATAATTSGGSWLLVNGATTTNGITGGAGQDIQVNVSPLGLAPGNYAGSIVINVAGAPANSIQVFLFVSAQPQVSISPATLLNLTAQAGTSTSAPLTVSSTGAATTFTVAVERLSPNFPVWLTVSPASGATGSQVTVTANTQGLTSGAAVGTITFTSASGGAVTVPVHLTIGGTGSGSLTVNPTSTNIAFQLGTQTPASRQITVTTSGTTAVQYTAQVTAGTWLSLSTFSSTLPGNTVITSSTPSPFYVVANPAGLGAGTYQGRVVVTSPSIPGGSQEVTVQLIVSTQPLLQSFPEAIAFNQTLGAGLPTGQILSITSTSGAVLFQATGSTSSGGDWLVVSPSFGTTNQTAVQVSLNPTRVSQLAAGTYSGTVRIIAGGVANSPLDVPVTLTISGSTLISVNPAQLEFTTPLGATPGTRSLQITSTDGSNQQFTVATEYTGTVTGWLNVTPTFGMTGGSGQLVNVNVNPNAITAPGTYDATIVVTPLSATNAVPQRIPVKLTVTGTATVTASPTTLQFTQPGATAPAEQTVTLTSSVAGLNFIAGANQSWIVVSPPSGVLTTTGTPLTVRVNPLGLTPGQNYEGAVTVSVSNVTTLTIPVRFSYQNSGALTLSSNSLNFTFQTGSTAPAAQNIGVTSSGVAIPFTAAAATTTGGSWLSVSPTSGTTTATGGAATNLAVSVNPSGLAPGTYQGTITLTSTNASNSPQTVNVTLVVSQAAAPVITSVSHGATNQPTAAAAGLIMAIKGTNLGPTTGVGAQIQSGAVTTQIGEVRVLFDSVPAPVLFARQDQVNTIAPYFVATRTSTRVVVEYKGVRSDPIDLRVVETAPGIFTLDATGNGQGAILNQDNTVNGPNNAAARGSIVVIYATGEGQVTPAGSDGQVIGANNLRRPLANVTVRIGGQNAEVLYAGSAPGLVSGALQVNVRVPQLTIGSTTTTPVELIIGNGSSSATQNVSLTVRP